MKVPWRGIVVGLLIYHGARYITPRAWVAFAGACFAGTAALFSLGDPYENSSTGDGTVWTPQAIFLALACIVLFIGACVDTFTSARNAAIAQYNAQLAWDQQQAAESAQRLQDMLRVKQPATQRTERSVRVVRRPPAAPAPATPSTPPVRSALTIVTGHRRPVRHAELAGSVEINDRRAFDPETGE
jgi:hypothetical protein